MQPDDTCNHVLLRALLVEALREADLCDPVVAIHVNTALDLLDQRFGIAV